jgi:FHA domain
VDATPRLHRSSPADLKARLEAERGGTPFLVYRDEDGLQRIVELAPHRPRLSIGRQPASDVALAWDEEVSRAHAEIERIGEVWTLVDDGRSRNGSYVGGERVHGRCALHDGDVITIGRTTLEFLAPQGDGDPSTVVGVRGATPRLTAAQRRVLVALCRPLVDSRFGSPPSNRELAAELCLSVETVKFHLHALFELFGIAHVRQHHKRAALARLALEQGAVSPREVVH